MLKSKFNLSQAPEPEAKEEEAIKAPKDVKGEGEAEEVEEEEEKEDSEPLPPIELTPKGLKKLDRFDVAVRLSMLGRTADGDGYTYLKATLTGLGLVNIDAIKLYRHLQFVDVSQNNLTLESLQVVTTLPYLCLIQADANVLYSAALKKCKYLQVMIFNENHLTSVHDVFQPELSTLEVGNNKIQKIHFDNRMSKIKCLDFRNNIITDILGLDFPMLDSLFLAGNKIKSLVGLEKLVNLRALHVRNNPIRLLDGFDAGLKKLKYINLRNCKVSTLRQIKKLRALPALDTLILKGCPYLGGTGEEDAEAAAEEEDPELRVELIATLPRLARLNKQVISPEERNEANELIKLWAEEGEKEDEEEVVEEQAAEAEAEGEAEQNEEVNG